MGSILFQFSWTPYRQHQISRLIVIDIPLVSRAKVPVICFATVEFQQADQVMRQFGLRQNIPSDPINLDQVHRDDLRGRNDRDWPAHHQQWIAIWNDRHNRVIQGVQFTANVHLRDSSVYMQWYINHNIRYISPSVQSSDDEVSFPSLKDLFINSSYSYQ